MNLSFLLPLPCFLCAGDGRLIARFPGMTGAALVPCPVCHTDPDRPLVVLPHPYRDIPTTSKGAA